MVIYIFYISDKDWKERFFDENFLLADVQPDVVFGISFLIINNADINFQAWYL